MSATSTAATPPASGAPTTTTPQIRKSEASEDVGILEERKRKILGLGKKKEGAGAEDEHEAGATQRIMSPSLLPSPPLSDQRTSPRGSPHMRPVGIGASPNRRSMVRSASPGLHSPASSAIFERNVQEPEPSADVPAHIKTEDHIPPALDASSLAITDDHLNPDEVEIVMHSAHQPASTAVAESMADSSVYSPSLAQQESMASSRVDANEPTSNYGSLDLTDLRRVSFISFADVVQAEHVEEDIALHKSSEALQFQSLSATAAHRSPSPIRSPVAAHGMGPSPTTSGDASPRALDHGRIRSSGSTTSPMTPGTHSPPVSTGEMPLQIETLRQTLHKSRSGDLSGGRSQPLSPATFEDSTTDRPPYR